MLEISPRKVVHIIFQAREKHIASAELHEFIANLNDDEKLNLVALTWIGRETFEPEEWADAIRTAAEEATAPTEEYLMTMPLFADYLENGLEKMGIDPTDEEEEFL